MKLSNLAAHLHNEEEKVVNQLVYATLLGMARAKVAKEYATDYLHVILNMVIGLGENIEHEPEEVINTAKIILKPIIEDGIQYAIGRIRNELNDKMERVGKPIKPSNVIHVNFGGK